MGKPIAQSLQEVEDSLEICRQLTQLVPNVVEEKVVEESAQVRKLIHHQPKGVSFIISSWDFPIRGCLPQCVMAVLTGNSVILKHSPLSPLSGRRIAQAFDSDLVQDCLISILNLGELIKGTFVDYIHFTGATESAQSVSKVLASTRFVDTNYLLTTTNTVYVAEDTDLSSAAAQIVKNVMNNSGQDCNKFCRVLVHSAIAKEFVEVVEPLVRSYSIGDPNDSMTDIGPLAPPELPFELNEFVELATQSGASLVCGGEVINDNQGKGRFFLPTVLVRVDENLIVSATLAKRQVRAYFNRQPSRKRGRSHFACEGVGVHSQSRGVYRKPTSNEPVCPRTPVWTIAVQRNTTERCSNAPGTC